MDNYSSVNREERLPAFKLTIVQYAIVAILLVLLSGLWRLQVIGAQNYRTLAEQNRIRKVPILAPRGKLFDREGRLLVDNYPSVSCFLIREPGRDLRADFPLISRGLHMTPEQLEATLKHYALAPKYDRSRSNRTSPRMRWSSSRPIATSCRNWKRLTNSAGFIPATALPPT